MPTSRRAAVAAREVREEEEEEKEVGKLYVVGFQVLSIGC